MLRRHSLSWKTQSVPAAPATDAGDTGHTEGQAGLDKAVVSMGKVSPCKYLPQRHNPQ